MNIIILSTSKEQAGGVERFSFYLRDTFVGAGHSVKILANEDVTGLSAMILRMSRYVGMKQPLLGWLLGRMAIRQGFDLCIGNGMLGWNVTKRKVINVQHGTFARAAVRIDKGRFFLKYLIKFYVWAKFEGLAARRASVCVAVSNETKESVETYYRVNDVRVIPNAVDTDLFRPLGLERKNQAIFVGRFELAKGKEILEGMKAYFEKKGWNMLVAERLSQKELVQAYNESKIFLLPSLHEGCSYALLDAMSCGLPFLASPVGLVSDFVKQGLFPECIVSEQSVEAYTKEANTLLRLGFDHRSELSLELRNYILTFHSIKGFNESYLGVAKEVIG